MCHCILVTIFVSLKDYNLLGSIDACASMQEELEKGEESDEGDILDNKMLEADNAGRATNKHDKELSKTPSKVKYICMYVLLIFELFISRVALARRIKSRKLTSFVKDILKSKMLSQRKKKKR